MLHPVFTTLIKRPDLVADHVTAYVELVQQEATGLGADWVQRGLAWAMAAFGAVLFLMLAGVALMLGAVLQFHWMLLTVPGAVLLLTLVALARARTPQREERFKELKAQLQSDAQALREAANHGA
jgi:hypothetical protein